MTKGPVTLHLDITNGCNTNCVTCWDHSPLLATPREPAWKGLRADTDALLATVSNAASLGRLSNVIVSGMGDPLTHPRVFELLSGLKAMKLNVTLITNLLAPGAGQLAATTVDTLLIGIHAADADGYQAFHPASPAGSWDRLMERLAARRSAGCRDRHVQVICSLNANNLVSMIELAAEYHAGRVNFKLASLGRGTEAVRVTDTQRKQLLSTDIFSAIDRASTLGVAHNLETFRTQVEAGGAATAPISDVGCHMGDLYARIAVDGTVYYCCNTETAIGRIGSGVHFSDLWLSSAWNAMRARLARGEFFPGCVRCGKFEQNAKIAAKRRASGCDA